MQNIKIFYGKLGLSEFKLNKIRSLLPKNTNLTVHEIYLVLAQTKLAQTTITKMEQLVDGKKIANLQLSSQQVLITPRLGTVSPWSSKATEIALRCGLTEITRIEKCLYFTANTHLQPVYEIIHDRMTESIISDLQNINQIFLHSSNQSYQEIDILSQGKELLHLANQKMGLALSMAEIDYLYMSYSKIKRNPTDVELMMFAQANSEHCRHKIFNAYFTINGEKQPKTLFQLIKDTYRQAPNNVLLAYNDNSSVITGSTFNRFYANFYTKEYQFHYEPTHILMKVETHNHPTAISPFAGAATGSGGEIRDEGATGRGAKPKAGLTGFSVSYLNLMNCFPQSNYGKPLTIKSALEIMQEGPIGGASFNNEFGRPNLCGYFRSFEQQIGDTYYGYHKPIMLAGGYGNISQLHIHKQEVSENALIIQLGGPGFLIGLGGGSASSMAGGENLYELDFNSVQRSNPEMERRCQEVIDSCVQLGEKNPILSIHDVGAGGLSNAIPELIHGSNKGGKFELRAIPVYDTSMSPLEIWCNESQERYVLAIKAQNLSIFSAICQRENCPFAVVGQATKEKRLILTDETYHNNPIDINMEIILGNPPKTVKEVHYIATTIPSSLNTQTLNFTQAIYKVLSHPTVASKSFLITIADRTVGGHTVRDQMVGKWQIPVADCAITAFGYTTNAGEVMAIGERSPVATLNASAASRLAITESLTNLASCYIKDINDVKLSANWMASCGSTNQDAILYEAVKAASNFCQILNIAIPVGKDSLAMKMLWSDKTQIKQVISPVSLIISAFAPTVDCLKHKTPELVKCANSNIILLSLNNNMRLGGSILQECYQAIGNIPPDVDNPNLVGQLFKLIQKLHEQNLILAYHDRSDGGLIATLSEMIFASRIGIILELNEANLAEFLFNEEIGIVLQVKNQDLNYIQALSINYGLHCISLGKINLTKDNFTLINQQQIIFDEPRYELQLAWSQVSYNLQKLRDNPICADNELTTIKEKNPGLFAKLSFDLKTLHAPALNLTKPKIAILREQGINGHLEMAASFSQAGFSAIDVHMNDILNGSISLHQFIGIAACGGFSYGDVLGAGQGWAKSILFNPKLKQEFSQFFNRQDTFALGVCNGCQMLAQLTEIIPGANYFPRFTKNQSEQFEARLAMVEITPSPSILFKDMVGSQLPIIVSHGEGLANFAKPNHQKKVKVALRYIDNNGEPTKQYPFNPNGSPQGITALTNDDGRFTIMMPHPERTFKTRQLSWHDKSWGEISPWFKIFLNAYDFVK